MSLHQLHAAMKYHLHEVDARRGFQDSADLFHTARRWMEQNVIEPEFSHQSQMIDNGETLMYQFTHRSGFHVTGYYSPRRYMKNVMRLDHMTGTNPVF